MSGAYWIDPIVWVDVDVWIGLLTDKQVAKLVGVPTERVTAYRRSRGWPPPPRWRRNGRAVPRTDVARDLALLYPQASPAAIAYSAGLKHRCHLVSIRRWQRKAVQQ